MYGYIVDGNYYPFSRESPNLPSLVEDSGKFVLKPMDGMQGRGFKRVEDVGRSFRINGTAHPRKDVAGLVDEVSDSVVTEWIAQHDYSTTIYPHTTNTLRLVTAIDPETDSARVIRACHRFGTRRSRPTDNWSRGALAAPVDTSTGTIKEAITLDSGARRVFNDSHPESGAQISAVRIPFWGKTVSLVRELAEFHLCCPLVGWDVVISPEGPVVIEGNTEPGEHLLQLEEGLLANESVRKLLEINREP